MSSARAKYDAALAHATECETVAQTYLHPSATVIAVRWLQWLQLAENKNLMIYVVYKDPDGPFPQWMTTIFESVQKVTSWTWGVLASAFNRVPSSSWSNLAFGVGVLAGVVRIDILRALESIRELQPGVQAGRVAASAQASVQMGVAVVIFHVMFLAFAIAGRLHLLGLRPPRP